VDARWTSTRAGREVRPNKGEIAASSGRAWLTLIAQAAAEQLTPETLRQTHEAAHRRIRKLVERGRREGAFRTDVPAEWLVTVFHALIHAAGDDVRAGRIRPGDALEALGTTIRDVYAGRNS
jgi:hypothetical protein